MHSRRKHLVSGVHLERADNSLEEVYHVLVLLVVRAVAGNVERRRAGSMLGELVRPETLIGLALTDPVLIHCERRETCRMSSWPDEQRRTVIKQVNAAKRRDKSVNPNPGIRGDRRAIGQNLG